MERVVTSGGRVGHIVNSVVPAEGDRLVTTVCGKTHPEYEVHVDNDADYCVTCEKAVFGTSESEPEVKEPEPKKAPAPTKTKTEKSDDSDEN